MILQRLRTVRRPEQRSHWASFWLPYIAIYQLINRFPVASLQAFPMSRIDEAIPFIPELLPVYVAYIPFFWWTGLRSESDREFAEFLCATYLQLLVCSIVWVVCPVTLPRELYYSGPAFGWADLFWRWFDAPNNCFPSLHAANCLLFIQLNWHRPARYTHAFAALAIIASTVLVKQHYVVDLIAGAAVYLIAAAFLSKLRASHVSDGFRLPAEMDNGSSALNPKRNWV